MIDRFPQLDGIRITHVWTGNVAFAFDYMPHMGTDQGLHYLLGCNGNGVAMMTYLGTQTAQEDRRRPQRADQPVGRPRLPRARPLQRRAVVPAHDRRLVPHARLDRPPTGGVMSALPVTLRGRPARRRANRRRGGAHALPQERDAVAHRQGRHLGQVREPAVHRLVQGARRAQHAAAAHARRAQARRHRHVGRQPRPGRRLSRRPARHSRRPSSCRRFTPNTKVAAHPRPSARAWSCTATRWPKPAPSAHALAAREKLVFVHPYDDPRIIAGQGTIALEMLEDVPGARHARGAGRRRRHDRGLRRRGARAEARRSR